MRTVVASNSAGTQRLQGPSTTERSSRLVVCVVGRGSDIGCWWWSVLVGAASQPAFGPCRETMELLRSLRLRGPWLQRAAMHCPHRCRGYGWPLSGPHFHSGTVTPPGPGVVWAGRGVNIFDLPRRKRLGIIRPKPCSIGPSCPFWKIESNKKKYCRNREFSKGEVGH